MSTEAHNCSTCSCCQDIPSTGENRVEGFKLILCAFLVFVVPLIAAALGGGLGRRFGGTMIWTVVGAGTFTVIAIALAVVVTRWIARPSSRTRSEDTCHDR